MSKIILFTVLLMNLLFGTGVFASIDNRNEQELINAVYDQLQERGYLDGIKSSDKTVVYDIIKKEVENGLKRVDLGELSLDTDSANYFFFDTIGNVIKDVASVVKGVVNVALTIGGKVFNAVKGALGTVVNVGLKFLSKIDNGFIKTVIGVGADALGTLIAGSGEALAAASLVIPVAGEVIAPVLATLAPFATMAINSSTVGLITDAIGSASRTVLKLKDSDLEKGFTAATATKTSDSTKDKETKQKFTKQFATMCSGLMKHLKVLDADEYNALSDNVKKGAAYCNHFVGAVNATATK